MSCLTIGKKLLPAGYCLVQQKVITNSQVELWFHLMQLLGKVMKAHSSPIQIVREVLVHRHLTVVQLYQEWYVNCQEFQSGVNGTNKQERKEMRPWWSSPFRPQKMCGFPTTSSVGFQQESQCHAAGCLVADYSECKPFRITQQILLRFWFWC